jgi:hypothetical protein
MAELVGLNVEVIVTHAPAGVRAAKAATSTIPVGIAGMHNADVAGQPIAEGFINFLLGPGVPGRAVDSNRL